MSKLFIAAKNAFLDPQIGWKTTHFWGPVANWGIAIAGLIDVTKNHPKDLSVNSTISLSIYSLVFMRFAWQVQPRNYLLLACHIFNTCVQGVKFYRIVDYQSNLSPIERANTDTINKTYVGVGLGVIAAGIATGPLIQKMITKSKISDKVKNLLNHPAGPFTVFFWAPIGKWGLSIANLIDYKMPTENVSLPQQLAFLITGLIWTRYSFVISPVNSSLAAVNFALASTSGYHLLRKYAYDPFRI